MAQVVIADAGPLIALAKADRLAILQQLFGCIVIPEAVRQECLLKSSQDSSRIRKAIHTDWNIANQSALFLVPALRAEPGIRRSALSGIRQPGKDEGDAARSA